MALNTNFLPLLLLVFTLQIQGQDLKTITYNIKYDRVSDTVNNWNDRKAAMVALLKSEQPEFIGMQEVLHRQLDYLHTALTDYSYIGVGRDDGKQEGEYSPIFYNSKAYRLIEANTFWLSTTPEQISVGWDAAMERICTYGLFEEVKTKKRLWVFNSHFDHRGVEARKKSAALILRKIKKLNTQKLPVLLMGDFNLTPEEKPILLLKEGMDDGLTLSKSPLSGPKGTFNGFDLNAPMEKRIDYIFMEGFEVIRYEHLDKRLPNGKHISDHLPVVATVKLK